MVVDPTGTACLSRPTREASLAAAQPPHRTPTVHAPSLRQASSGLVGCTGGQQGKNDPTAQWYIRWVRSDGINRGINRWLDAANAAPPQAPRGCNGLYMGPTTVPKSMSTAQGCMLCAPSASIPDLLWATGSTGGDHACLSAHPYRNPTAANRVRTKAPALMPSHPAGARAGGWFVVRLVCVAVSHAMHNTHAMHNMYCTIYVPHVCFDLYQPAPALYGRDRARLPTHPPPNPPRATCSYVRLTQGAAAPPSRLLGSVRAQKVSSWWHEHGGVGQADKWANNLTCAALLHPAPKPNQTSTTINVNRNVVIKHTLNQSMVGCGPGPPAS